MAESVLRTELAARTVCPTVTRARAGSGSAVSAATGTTTATSHLRQGHVRTWAAERVCVMPGGNSLGSAGGSSDSQPSQRRSAVRANFR